MDLKTTNFDVSTEQIYLEQTAELPIDTSKFVVFKSIPISPYKNS